MKKIFFSSRRRHTRWPRDWSSDVCSSDLDEKSQIKNREKAMKVLKARVYDAAQQQAQAEYAATRKSAVGTGDRSEERRVGKECRSGLRGKEEEEKVGVKSNDV